MKDTHTEISVQEQAHTAENDGIDRRNFLSCMAWAGTGLLWSMVGGVPTSKLFAATSGGAGGQMAHVCKLVVYLTDIRHREPVYRTMGEYIRGVHPVCTGLVVVALARPSWLVEIDATAVIPD